MFKNSVKSVVAGLGAALVPVLSFAAPAAAIDVTDSVTGITNQTVPVSLLAGAGMILLVTLIAWRYARRAAK